MTGPRVELNLPRRPLSRESIWRALGPVALFVALTVVFTYPRTLYLTNGVSDPGDPLQTAWILAWESRALIADPSSLFEGNILYPHRHVLAYSEHMLGLLPLAAPLNWLGHNPILTYNLLFLLSYAGSGLAAYALARELTGDRRAALVAGFGFGFVPYRAAHFGHLEILALFWMPLALLFLHRLLIRRRGVDAALFALFFNLQALVSYYYAFMLTFAVVTILVVWFALKHTWPDRRLLAGLILTGAVTALIQAPIAAIYFRVHRELGLVRTLDEVRALSAHLWDFLTAPPYTHLYATLTLRWRDPAWSEHSLFPGLVLLALALVGLAVRWGRKRGLRAIEEEHLLASANWWAYLAVFLVTILLMLGPELYLPPWGVRLPLPPYLGLYHFLPGLQGLRTPARFWGVGLLALSVLAAYGVATLLTRFRGETRQGHIGPRVQCATPFIVGVLILLGAEFWSVPTPVTLVPVGESVPIVYQRLRTDPASQVILELPMPLKLNTSDAIVIETMRMYYSTIHWKRLVNGYVAFDLPDRDRLAEELRNFPDVPSIERLRALGVDTLLIHQNELSASEWKRIWAGLAVYSEELELVDCPQGICLVRLRAPGG